MKNGLSAVGQLLYAAVMLAVGVADLVIQVKLFTSGNAGWGVAYFLFGWPLTLTIGHWIGLLLGAPFALAGSRD